MSSILELYISVFRKRPLFMFFVIVIYIAIILHFVSITKQEKEGSSVSKLKETVASEIFKCIDNNTNLDTLSEKVKIIFNSYNRKSKGKLDEYGLVSLLEDIYAQNVSIEKKEKLNILIKLIAKQKEKDPYYGLKFEQEIVIKNIEKELSKSNSGNDYNDLILQIKEIVRRQNAEIEELKKKNTWGIPVGIAGIVLTIIFGLLSLTYPIIKQRKSAKANNGFNTDAATRGVPSSIEKDSVRGSAG